MKNYTAPIAILSLGLWVSGCGNLNTAYRDFGVDDGSGAMVDIKQRAIISAKREGADGNSTTVVCAEPSPDALSAFAAEFAAEAEVPEAVTARLVSAIQEASSFVGLRTQSIQLLRDGLYRLCEGYMNGSLTAAQYDILMRRYQKYMIALLGIEQLSGVVRSPTVVIGSEGSAQAAQSISSIRAQIQGVDSQIAALEKEKNGEGVSEDRKTQIEVEIEDLKKDRAALERAIENARGLAVSGEAGVVEISYPGGANGQTSGTENSEIVKAVENIVISVINVDDTGQLCFLYLAHAGLDPMHPLTRSCADFLSRQDAILRIHTVQDLLSARPSADASAISAAVREVNALFPPPVTTAPADAMALEP